MVVREVSSGIFKEDRNIYTKNLIPGKRVYGEKLLNSKVGELREWDPTRSKLASTVLNGLNIIPIKADSKILYLGASAGTTPSHISDIVVPNLILYFIYFS